MRRLVTTLITATAFVGLPAAGHAGGEPLTAVQPPNCPLMAPASGGTDHALLGTGLIARDPYSGLLSRNRLFFSFSVRGTDAAIGRVARVVWALDGRTVRVDPTVRYE